MSILDALDFQFDTAYKYYNEKNKKNVLDSEEKELVSKMAVNHIVVLLFWLVRHDYISEEHMVTDKMYIDKIKDNQENGFEFFDKCCDWKLYTEDAQSEIVPFLKYCYDEDEFMDEYYEFIKKRDLGDIFEVVFTIEDSLAFEEILTRIYTGWCQEKR